MAAVTGPISTLPGSVHNVPCKHCSASLKQVYGVWHAVGSVLFPQYCKNNAAKTNLDQLHEPVACDDHDDRPAVVRVQGETDSMGCELHDLCQECYDKWSAHMSSEHQTTKVCDWCKAEKDSCRPHRDYEEGSSGPVYNVCIDCRIKETESILEDYAEGDLYDEVFYDLEASADTEDDEPDDILDGVEDDEPDVTPK